MAPTPGTPRTRLLAAAAFVVAAGAAAAGLAPVSIPVDLVEDPLETQERGEGTFGQDLELVELDVDPLGRHAVRAEVGVASGEGPAVGPVEVTVEALDGEGEPAAEASSSPVRIPAEGAWEGTVRLSGTGLVDALERVRVTVGADGATATLP